MNLYGLFFIFLLILYSTIAWIFPKLLSWLVERKYKVVLRIGRITLLYLKLCDVHISRKGFTISIEEISVKSSFFNSEIRKLVTLIVKDVRINKDVGTKTGNKAFNVENISNKAMDFRNKKIPHFVTTFAQFMAIHIYNISAMLLRAESPGGLIYATASELHIDGSVVENARKLLVNINLSETSTKILRHADRQVNENTCLGELTFAINLEASFIAQGCLSFEALTIKTSQTVATIYDAFYNVMEESNKAARKKVEKRVTPDQDDRVTTDEDDNLYDRIFPIFPKCLSIAINDTYLQSVGEDNMTEYRSSLETVSLSWRITPSSDPQHFPNASVQFAITRFEVKNSTDHLLYLHSINFSAKLIANVLDAFLTVNTLAMTYQHNLIYRWYKSYFMKKPSTKLIIENNSTKKKSENNWLRKFARRCVINGRLQLQEISFVPKFYEYTSNMGLAHMQITLNQFCKDVRGSNCSTLLPKDLVSNRHWTIDMLVESLWWSFRGMDSSGARWRRIHYWGTPFSLGMALIKCTTATTENKLDVMLDSFQIEWSDYLADYLILCLQCFKDYGIKFSSNRQKSSEPMILPSISLSMSCVNWFLQSENDEFIVIRLNTLQIEKNPKISPILSIEHCKLLTVKNDQVFYNCVRSEDITDFKTYIRIGHVRYITDDVIPEIRIELIEEIGAYWSCNFHVRLLTLYRNVKNFLDTCTNQLLLEFDQRSPEPYDLNINVHLLDVSAFYIEISDKHSAKVALHDMVISLGKDLFSILNNTAIISIDGADIFTIQGIHLFRISDNPMIRDERADNEFFKLNWNKTWGLAIDLCKLSFPYAHNYADAVQNELISVVKWLKMMHNKEKVPFTIDSPLPSDMLINIKEFVYETSDDPFEVKLRKNFELLVDEHNENMTRLKMLQDTVTELRKTHLHLPTRKVEEMYESLKQKNADVYIERSKKLNAAPPRTRLFAWTMTDLQIMVLADPSIHGTENVVRIMREIDFETPWPEDGLEFTTLWCRVVSLCCLSWKFQLRDFPQPLLDIRDCRIWGQLIGAEQVSPRRAIRTVSIDLGEPFGSVTVERGMQPLKFYHDLSCEIKSYSYAFGPCWEPVIAQCDLSFDKIFPPSKDPSPRLPFWDKMRLLLHGRLTMDVKKLTVLLHASLDPYNTTEEMELTWTDVVIDWTNAKFLFKGNFGIFVRTASKYDDCKLLHLPNLKLVINMHWLCLADPNDHHNVIYCAPDKIPEYSINQVHDSFRAFRSQNVNLSIVLETKPIPNQSPNSGDIPVLSLYGSTLRWFENLKLILSGVTRPTRRGKIFDNVRPKKLQLSRHYKKVNLLMGLHKFQVCYWMSFAMQRGCELLGGRLSSSSEHTLSLVPIEDGLKHRPKAEWSIVYMNSELNDSEIWLKSALQDDPEQEAKSFRLPVEKCYCLSVAKVSYGRETVFPIREHTGEKNKETPTHRLVVYDLKGAWTKSNRYVAFALFDSFMKSKQMKKNLSTEALKGFRKETNNTTPLKRRNMDAPGTPPNAAVQALQAASAIQDTPSPLTKLQSGHAANMLQQLIAEAENKNTLVFSDDLSSATRQQNLQGLQACQEDDVQHKNWQISLVNAQVLLKGCETKGYVILSAAKAEIVQRIHRPVWKDRTLVSKTTWVGTLECLQYYATVNADKNETVNENIRWLTVDNIQEKESTVISEIPQVPNMVGSGVSVGAVVSDTVGASIVGESAPIQVQRIVSRCKCEFFYVGYGTNSVDPAAVGELPPPPQEDVSPWDQRQTAVDAFTLMHHDLDVCTNSLQYAMLLDVVNNLLLYVEPHRKEACERLARMRFQLQLHSIADQRRPIQNLQTQVRSTLSKLRRLEKETYLVHKALMDDPYNAQVQKEMDRLESLVYECKNQLNAQSEELDMMLSCYKESQLLATNRLATLRSDKPLTIVKANEIFFKHAQWRLTEADGQIGIADVVLSNFLYTKTSKSDDSLEHLLELGYLRMTNLLPNQIYKEVLCPTEIQSNMPVDHKRVVRVFCREKPPVGGISVKEHFEINVVPLTIGLTKKFYQTMMNFCFSDRATETVESTERSTEELDENSRGKKSRSSKRNRDSNFYVHIDDVEKMKERAEKNKLFIYIKIPEVPVRLSYKGNKEKNLEDIRDFSLVIPTLEYHNVTWTWLDLLMAIRSDSRKVILSQAIKQKLQIKRNIGSSDQSCTPDEEDLARLLFGAKHTAEGKPARKSVSGVFKFGK